MYTSPTFLPPTTPWPLLFFLFFSFFCDLPSAIFIALMLVGPESQLARGYLQAWSRICGAFYSTQNFGIILVGMLSNGKDHFSLIRPEFSGPALMVVLFDGFSHFSRLDQNVPSHLRKLLSPVPLFCILLARTSLPNVQWLSWVDSVQPECTVTLGTWNFKPEFLLNGKRTWTRDFREQLRRDLGVGYTRLTPFQSWMLYNLLETCTFGLRYVQLF